MRTQRHFGNGGAKVLHKRGEKYAGEQNVRGLEAEARQYSILRKAVRYSANITNPKRSGRPLRYVIANPGRRAKQPVFGIHPEETGRKGVDYRRSHCGIPGAGDPSGQTRAENDQNELPAKERNQMTPTPREHIPYIINGQVIMVPVFEPEELAAHIKKKERKA